MIKLELTGIKYQLDRRTKKYLRQKIGSLDRYLKRDLRAPAAAHVILTLNDSEPKNRYVCEVTLGLPHSRLVARAGTSNMLASIDLVEDKLKAQLLKYKSKVSESSRRRRRALRRLVQGWPIRRRR